MMTKKDKPDSEKSLMDLGYELQELSYLEQNETGEYWASLAHLAIHGDGSSGEFLVQLRKQILETLVHARDLIEEEEAEEAELDAESDSKTVEKLINNRGMQWFLQELIDGTARARDESDEDRDTTYLDRLCVGLEDVLEEYKKRYGEGE